LAIAVTIASGAQGVIISTEGSPRSPNKGRSSNDHTEQKNAQNDSVQRGEEEFPVPTRTSFHSTIHRIPWIRSLHTMARFSISLVTGAMLPYKTWPSTAFILIFPENLFVVAISAHTTLTGKPDPISSQQTPFQSLQAAAACSRPWHWPLTLPLLLPALACLAGCSPSPVAAGRGSCSTQSRSCPRLGASSESCPCSQEVRRQMRHALSGSPSAPEGPRPASIARCYTSYGRGLNL
jgi:hypothetical protein